MPRADFLQRSGGDNDDEVTMNEPDASGRVQPVANLREYFCDALQGALAHQHVAVDGHTQHYVVNVLTEYARSETLYAQGAGERTPRPLAFILKDAIEAPNEAERSRHLQRLGDVSLFIAGFFSRSFARKLVDVDYHIAMGGRAYGALADRTRSGPRAVLSRVYAELAAKFQPMVDALNEISETAYEHSQRDVLRLYELWLKTGSQRAHRVLQGLGVQTTPGARSGFAH
jgi:hypothetical protein